MDQEIERDAQCFCCGADNENGLHLSFSHGEGSAATTLEVPPQYSGWKGVTHGGFLSMLLDEVMAHACHGRAEAVVTGEMNLRFIKPVPTGARISLEGRVEQDRGRILATKGWIRDETGTVAVEASARFMKLRSGGS